MKRHDTERNDNDRRRPAAQGRGTTSRDNRNILPLASATNDLRALCGRLNNGTASADDVFAAMRLSDGARVGTAPIIVVGDGSQMVGVEQKCTGLVAAYEALWSSLDDHAIQALIRNGPSGWPPTFVDVERAYIALAPRSAPAHVARIQMDPSDNVVRAAQRLGHALSDAARTREAMRTAACLPFAEAWTPVLDWAGAEHLRDCTPHARYTIAVVRRLDGDTIVFLRDVGGNRPSVGLLHVETRDMLPVDDARLLVLAPVPPALVIYGDLLGLFLAALAHRPVGVDYGTPAERLLTPTPAGLAQIKAALDSRRALRASAAASVQRLFPATVALDAYAPVRSVDLSECQLVLALRLFAGQVEARRTVVPQAATAAPPPSDTMAVVYSGPLHGDMASTDAPDAAAVATWDRVCAAAALPDGTLAESHRLVDVARLWGHEPDAAEIARPELLCASLALARNLLAQ
ncbi:hypothetical protein pqer_cds_1111 [Pandoravirus quercus]|uniref:Uncharacterized protein n=1 Tax=Pandoravirus quercus TaxID=2107709 RepID=A0A2U7UAR2_9VIRU|nr:hypothetical protein pqer_cds_1111 [Pandoravirus quercus]AVK75533.1 hypothetical protein pqer_cds_1111 [Pandoravirus quercus]